MRYFVTGATGFIGGEITRQLREAGHEITALVRTPAKAQALIQMGVQLHKGDILDAESVRAGMQGADGVFHIAAWYRVGADARQRALAERINVQGTRNVLEAMRDLNITKGVYTSSLAVFSDTGGRMVDESYRYDGPHLTEYDRTKWLAHYEVAQPMMEQGLPLVIVQPGLVYGPGDHSAVRDSLVQYLQGKLPMAPQGASYCWAHVEDIARGQIQAMEQGTTGESYIIAGPKHSFIETLAVAEQITGIPAPRMHPGPRLIRGMARVMDVVGRVMPLPESYTGEGLRVVTASYLGDNSKARRELGFDPRPLEAGLRETLHHEMTLLGMPISTPQAG